MKDAGEFENLRSDAEEGVASVVPLLELKEEEHRRDGTLDEASDYHEHVAETVRKCLNTYMMHTEVLTSSMLFPVCIEVLKKHL